MRSKQIVYADRPGIVKFLVYFMVPVYIQGKIRSDIIRYPVSIAVRIQCSERIVISEYANGKGDRATRIIGEIQGDTKAVIDTIVRNQCS